MGDFITDALFAKELIETDNNKIWGFCSIGIIILTLIINGCLGYKYVKNLLRDNPGFGDWLLKYDTYANMLRLLSLNSVEVFYITRAGFNHEIFNAPIQNGDILRLRMISFSHNVSEDIPQLVITFVTQSLLVSFFICV